MVFELVYPVSVKIVMQQGYLKQLMEFSSDNAITREQFAILRDHMNAYLSRVTA